MRELFESLAILVVGVLVMSAFVAIGFYVVTVAVAVGMCKWLWDMPGPVTRDTAYVGMASYEPPVIGLVSGDQRREGYGETQSPPEQKRQRTRGEKRERD